MRSWFCGWALLVCLVNWGCGGTKYNPAAQTYPVRGTVTYKGGPVAGATVTFFAAEADRTAAGMTNDQGVYQLTTFKSNDGAVAGKQGVSVSKGSLPDSAPIQDDQSPNYDPDVAMRPQPVVKPPIPVKYFAKETSGLEAVVTADGPNEFNFELVD